MCVMREIGFWPWLLAGWMGAWCKSTPCFYGTVRYEIPSADETSLFLFGGALSPRRGVVVHSQVEIRIESRILASMR